MTVIGVTLNIRLFLLHWYHNRTISAKMGKSFAMKDGENSNGSFSFSSNGTTDPKLPDMICASLFFEGFIGPMQISDATVGWVEVKIHGFLEKISRACVSNARFISVFVFY